MVINQKEVEPISISTKEQFYLVSETGYLLVFAQDQSTICLHTHIPITEFPEKEQEKLEAKYLAAIKALLKLKNGKDLTKDMIETFISKIYVYPGKRIEVLFRFTADDILIRKG